MEHFCVHGPGDVQGEPVVHGDEQTDFMVGCYAVDETGRLMYDSAFLSRPKGADKSGLGARFCMFEALGPCRFLGWAEGGETYRDPWGLGFTYTYRAGDPMGRPVKVPYVRCMATEEGQTGNVYDAIYFNLTDGPLAGVPGVDVGLTRTYLPGGGEITPSTASSASKDGGKETFVDFDETHLYNQPELRRMYDTVTRNMRKRKRGAGTWYLETTTMFAGGEDSVAERTYQLAENIRAGKTRRSKLLFDHRWGECEDLADENALRAAIIESFGEAIAWNDVDGIVDEFYDPRKFTNDSRRYFLNARADANDAWIAGYEWTARLAADKIVADKEMIALGFDGSRKRTDKVTDATALIACRISDGHVFEPLPNCVWEQPPGAAGANWEVPTVEVDAAVQACFARYDVVAFFADPAKWESWTAAWEAKYGPSLQVKASREHPIEWWMTGSRNRTVVQALDEFLSAVIDGDDFSHDGSHALTRHVLNARRISTPVGIQIAKETPDSPKKIDACVAAVLARRARREAVARGVKPTNKFVPRRIR